uniref:Uncharacterized protein n=1 Tax=Oryza punctata TaxID=4537 RepID=A0A0E0MLH2_ORYPU
MYPEGFFLRVYEQIIPAQHTPSHVVKEEERGLEGGDGPGTRGAGRASVPPGGPGQASDSDDSGGATGSSSRALPSRMGSKTATTAAAAPGRSRADGVEYGGSRAFRHGWRQGRQRRLPSPSAADGVEDDSGGISSRALPPRMGSRTMMVAAPEPPATDRVEYNGGGS